MSREKQIEEMASIIYRSGLSFKHQAERLYEAGYRKQSEGEWIYDFTLDDDDFYVCSVCGRREVVNGLCSERNPAIHYPYCNCGAKMKGADDE
jgi:hypothetical protein